MATKKYVLGGWMRDLEADIAAQKVVSFETKDGSVRVGRLTGVRMTEVTFNGRKAEIVDEFEMNGDTTDTIKFSTLKKIDTYDE